MVPPVRGPDGDEAEIHVAHLPVHRVLWRAGSDKGISEIHAGTTEHFISDLLLPAQLYNFLGYLMDNFTPSSNERKTFTSDRPSRLNLRYTTPRTSIQRKPSQ